MLQKCKENGQKNVCRKSNKIFLKFKEILRYDYDYLNNLIHHIINNNIKSVSLKEVRF